MARAEITLGPARAGDAGWGQCDWAWAGTRHPTGLIIPFAKETNLSHSEPTIIHRKCSGFANPTQAKTCPDVQPRSMESVW